MPETLERSSGEHHRPDCGIDSKSDKAASVPDNENTSTRTSRRSNSALPFPFDSESSLDQENGSNGAHEICVGEVFAKLIGMAAKHASLGSRIQKALGLSKKYPPGFTKGLVDQIIRSLNDFPQGYGKVAAIEDLGSDFLIYRKFGWLHNYALLHLQDELAELQDDLERLDKWDFSDGNPTLLVSRRLDYERHESIRKEIMAKLHDKLAQYDEALLRMQQIQSLKRPTGRSQRNVYNLISNTQSLVAEESDWIHEGPDLAALGYGGDHGWLNAFLEDLLNSISRGMTRALFRPREHRIKTGDEAIHLISPGRLNILIRAFITIIAAILLLVPVFILFKLQPRNPSEVERRSNYQILTIFIFTLLFSASCSIFTQARRQEVFTATAAYSAVLVVFLGNASNVMVSSASGN